MNPQPTTITLTVLGPYQTGLGNALRRRQGHSARRATLLVRPHDHPARTRKHLADSVARLAGGKVDRAASLIDAMIADLPKAKAHDREPSRKHWTLTAQPRDPFADPYDRRTVHLDFLDQAPPIPRRCELSPNQSQPQTAHVTHVGMS